MFAKNFSQYIYLNLETKEDSSLFERYDSIDTIVEALFFLKKKKPSSKTLIFIDEIQVSPKAVAQLRYFYEKYPQLYIIAAGSLLETLLDVSISFPVGRVEFLVMHPMSFKEFLLAIGEDQSAQMLSQTPFPSYAEETLFTHFHRYVQVGGMPEAVKIYEKTKDLSLLSNVYGNLITAFSEDVEKYAPTNKLVPIIRHILKSSFGEMASRVKYTGFGQSNYLAKDIKEAFMILQKAFLFQIVHPVTTTSLPLLPNLKKSPRLHLLDTALSIYSLQMEHELFNATDLNSVFSGRVIEHIVGQELFAQSNSPQNKLYFWVREKSQSTAEVDYIIQYKGKMIPIEVKSGAAGRLRSLHQFIDAAPHSLAVRLYKGPVSIEKSTTITGKAFTLINLPYFLVSQIEAYLEIYL